MIQSSSTPVLPAPSIEQLIEQLGDDGTAAHLIERHPDITSWWSDSASEGRDVLRRITQLLTTAYPNSTADAVRQIIYLIVGRLHDTAEPWKPRPPAQY